MGLKKTASTRILLQVFFILVFYSSVSYSTSYDGIDLREYYLMQDLGHVVAIEDIDGDGESEIARFNYLNNSILIYSLTEGQCSDIYLYNSRPFQNLIFTDILPNPDKELIVGCRKDGGFIFYIFADVLRAYGMDALKDSLFIPEGEDIDSQDGWDGSIYCLGSYDVNNDQSPELLFVIRAGWDKYPRKLVAYDVNKKTIEWEFESVNDLKLLSIIDINNDDTPEFIITGNAPHNDAVKGNRIDDRCRWFIADINGNEKYFAEFGKDSREITAEYYFDPTDSVHYMYCSVVYIYRQDPTVDKTNQTELFKINLSSHEIVESVRIEGACNTFELYKANNRNLIRVFVSDEEGNIRLFDADLNLLRQRRIGYSHFFVHAENLNSNIDDYAEFIVIGDNPHAFILNDLLNVCAYYGEECFTFKNPIDVIARIDNDSLQIYLNGINNIGEKVYYAFSIPEIPPVNKIAYFKFWIINNMYSISSILVLGALLTVSGLYFRKTTNSSREFNKIIQKTKTGLLKIRNGRLTEFNHTAISILSANLEAYADKPAAKLGKIDESNNLYEYLEKLPFITSDEPHKLEIIVESEEKEIEITKLNRNTLFKSSTYYLLIRELFKDRQEWLTLERGIAHDIGNPCVKAQYQIQNIEKLLSNTGDNPNMEMISSIEQAQANIRLALERVKKLTGAFQNIEIIIKRVNIDEYLKRFTILRKPSLTKNTKLIYEGNIKQPYAEIDAEYFATVLDNLLDNAVNSFSENDNNTIIISYSTAMTTVENINGSKLTRCVLIEVSDNGRGIPESKINKIFNIGYSSTRGLGLGLYKSKKIILQHKGKIEVNSIENQGTTFNIFLPEIDA